MKTFVVDASVILRFLLKEDTALVDIFSNMLRDAKKRTLILLSTPLLPLEVANGLRFTLKDQKIAEEIGSILLQLPILIVPLSDALIQKALSFSYDCGTTVYDASYHVLSIARNAMYITADKKYFDKAKQLGKIELIGAKN
ncbi:MAG: type II toxin-antitoxin system VapC family toxin [Patescibacteria group bacterium]